MEDEQGEEGGGGVSSLFVHSALRMRAGGSAASAVGLYNNC